MGSISLRGAGAGVHGAAGDVGGPLLRASPGRLLGVATCRQFLRPVHPATAAGDHDALVLHPNQALTPGIIIR